MTAGAFLGRSVGMDGGYQRSRHCGFKLFSRCPSVIDHHLCWPVAQVVRQRVFCHIAMSIGGSIFGPWPTDTAIPLRSGRSIPIDYYIQELAALQAMPL